MDSVNPKCSVCGQELTDAEAELTAEAEDMSLDFFRQHTEYIDEILCDKCAEGN